MLTAGATDVLGGHIGSSARLGSARIGTSTSSSECVFLPQAHRIVALALTAPLARPATFFQSRRSAHWLVPRRPSWIHAIRFRPIMPSIRACPSRRRWGGGIGSAPFRLGPLRHRDCWSRQVRMQIPTQPPPPRPLRHYQCHSPRRRERRCWPAAAVGVWTAAGARTPPRCSGGSSHRASRRSGRRQNLDCWDY